MIKNFNNFINENFQFKIDEYFPPYDGIWTKEHHKKFIELGEKMIGKNVSYFVDNHFYSGRFTIDSKITKNSALVREINIFIDPNKIELEIIDDRSGRFQNPIKSSDIIIKESIVDDMDPYHEENWDEGEGDGTEIDLNLIYNQFNSPEGNRIKDLSEHLNNLLIGKEVEFWKQTGPTGDCDKFKINLHKISLIVSYTANQLHNDVKRKYRIDWDRPSYDIKFNDAIVYDDKIVAWL